MTADFDDLIHVVWAQMWQVTVVAFAIGTLVRLCCRGRARLAYALWMLVVIKAIVPPFLSSPTGVFSWALASRAAENPATTGAPADRSVISREIVRRNRNRALTAGAAERAANRVPAMIWENFTLVVISTWITGFVVCTGFVVTKQIICSAVIRRSRLPVDERSMLALAELSRRLGVARDVRLIVTSRPIGPAVFGLVRPSILMPEQLLASNHPEQVELVLAHELIHVRRGDILAGKLQLIAQLLWWFHPMIWWVNREACRERERCCDIEVLSSAGCKPSRYARALLCVVEQKRQLRPLVAIPGVRALEVTSLRLESIMRYDKTDHRRASLISRVVFVTGAIVLVPGMGLTLRAHPTISDKADATALTAPANSTAATVEQTAPRSEGKTTEDQSANGRWRAQQVVARKAEADYHNARLTREVAEIVVVEYEEGIFNQDLATVEGEIKLAESDLERAKDRLDWARRMFKKGYVSKLTQASAELALKKARFALEQAQSKKKVLVDYTRDKTLKELKGEIEKARSDELAKKVTWERAKLKEKVLERKVNQRRAGE